MDLNIKSKFNVGDVVTVTRLQETGTIRNWKVNVSEREVSISYNIWFNDQVGSGWVAEVDLALAKPASKFKVGDKVQYSSCCSRAQGVVVKVSNIWGDPDVYRVKTKGCGILRFEGPQLQFVADHVSPHYFQD